MSTNIQILVDYLRHKREDDSEMNTAKSAEKAWRYLIGWRDDVPREEAEGILIKAGYSKTAVNKGYKSATAEEKPRVRRKARTGPELGEVIDPEAWTTTKWRKKRKKNGEQK